MLAQDWPKILKSTSFIICPLTLIVHCYWQCTLTLPVISPSFLLERIILLFFTCSFYHSQRVGLIYQLMEILIILYDQLSVIYRHNYNELPFNISSHFYSNIPNLSFNFSYNAIQKQIEQWRQHFTSSLHTYLLLAVYCNEDFERVINHIWSHRASWIWCTCDVSLIGTGTELNQPRDWVAFVQSGSDKTWWDGYW